MIVRYTIELSWSHGTHSGEIEIPDEDIEGATEEERDKLIEEAVGDAVANEVSWGWEITSS